MSDISLAVSSWSWHDDYYAGRWSLLDLPAAAQEAGLSLIECNDFMLPPPRFSRLRRPLLDTLPGSPPELWRYSRRSLQELARRSQQYEVTILAWTINSDLAVSPLYWPLQKVYLRLGVWAAKSLQARLLRLNLGGEAGAPSEVDQRVAQRLADFVGDSQKWYPGLLLTVENHWGLSTDIERHLRIVRAARGRLPLQQQSHLGCCFDPNNMPDYGRDRWWLELAGEANHYHFKTTAFDEKGNDEGLPHAYLLSLLREAGYQGDASIEFQGEGDALENVRRSRELFQRLRQGAETGSQRPGE